MRHPNQDHYDKHNEALLQKVPEYADQKHRSEDIASLKRMAIDDYGFSPEEVEVIHHHGHILMARDAREAKALRTKLAEHEARELDRKRADDREKEKADAHRRQVKRLRGEVGEAKGMREKAGAIAKMVEAEDR